MDAGRGGWHRAVEGKPERATAERPQVRKSRPRVKRGSITPRVDPLMVEMPQEYIDWIAKVAIYEARTQMSVKRSMMYLGRRVYEQLSADISPYCPAHIDVTNDEIAATVASIKRRARERKAFGLENVSAQAS